MAGPQRSSQGDIKPLVADTGRACSADQVPEILGRLSAFDIPTAAAAARAASHAWRVREFLTSANSVSSGSDTGAAASNGAGASFGTDPAGNGCVVRQRCSGAGDVFSSVLKGSFHQFNAFCTH